MKKDFPDLQSTLETLHQKYLPLLEGHTADYIPELSKANTDHFAIVVATVDGTFYKVGDWDKNFTMQSTSKPFVYGLALQDIGHQKMLCKIGVEPTGEAFNSIIELEKESHRPYNPMINSGAIAVSSLINGSSANERLKRIKELFENLAGHSLEVDEAVFTSEKRTGHRNRAIAYLLKHFGIIVEEDIEANLDLYFKQCSLLVNTIDLALMAATLANAGIQPITKKKVFEANTARDILSLMFTCGMYDSAGEWAYTVGLPAKSGVSGALFASVPGKMGIAVYSPKISNRGHSVRAVKVFEELAKKYSLSIFSNGDL